MPRGAKGFKQVTVRGAPPPKNGFRRGKAGSMLASITSGGDQLEKSITNLCGPEYMDQLSQVTGQIESIDLEVYKRSMEVVDKCDNNILILLDRICKIQLERKSDISSLKTIFKHFEEQVKTMDFAHKSIVPKTRNPSTLEVPTAYMPKMLLLSPWFEDVRLIEKTIYKFIDQTFISGGHLSKMDQKRKEISSEYSWENYSKILNENPPLRGLGRVFNIDMGSDDKTYEYFMKLQHYSNQIINIIMLPMYDVKNRIEKSWDKKLSKIFKSMSGQDMNKEFVIKLLVQFVNAKYRSEITGNPKYFTQMLKGGEDASMGSVNGSRFLDVMDMINTEQMDPSSKGKRFTEAAKTIMHKLVKAGDTVDTKLIMEVEAIMKETDIGDALGATQISEMDMSKIESLSVMFSRANEEEEEEEESSEDEEEEEEEIEEEGKKSEIGIEGEETKD